MQGDSDSGTSTEYSDNNRPALEPYKDEERLRELYRERDWSQYQIADHFDVTQQTVSYWMNQLGIETKEPNKSISRSVREDGKVQYHVPDGEGGRFRFYRHQLVALLAEDGDGDGSWHVEDPFDLISREENDLVVHHCMNAPVPVDIPENLEVMSQAEHVRGHAGGAIVHHPRVVLREVFDEEDPLSEDRKRAIKSQMWRRRFEKTSAGVADD